MAGQTLAGWSALRECSSMNDIVIVSAARTPVGSFNGALSTISAQSLGAIALRAAFARAGVEAGDVALAGGARQTVLAEPARRFAAAIKARNDLAI